VLDAGCGHGTDRLAFAPKVRRFIGYDAVESFIAIARRWADESSLTNVALVRCNSSPRYNGGAARIPAADHTLDLIISRRGPTDWIADARRVCRSGARLIQLNPAGHADERAAPRRQRPGWRPLSRLRRTFGDGDRASLEARKQGSDSTRPLAAVERRADAAQGLRPVAPPISPAASSWVANCTFSALAAG
jgi:SAM-dependent methyltransferase